MYPADSVQSYTFTLGATNTWGPGKRQGLTLPYLYFNPFSE
ncbi:hypothetical protein ACJVC5_07595 [Peredibacter sp. HCB2-198]